ncbi:collagen binding domain-containing protein [Arthrobacter sp. NPDC090010]|uniref:MSCRAMM family protein n=1 Tax=Arthrobacter sp. NPDC090010 TaxID=3363942 RepID=UPI0037F557CF
MAHAISRARRRFALFAVLISGLIFAGLAPAQAAGTGSISGTVTAPAGVDITQTTVSLDLETPDGNTMFESETHPDSTGAYSFEGKWPTRYKLTFANPGALTVWNGGAPTEAAAPWITLAEGQTITGQDANLVYPGGSISGMVTVPVDWTPVGNVNVEAYSDAWGDSAAASTAPDADGKYTLSGLLPGSYKVKFTYGIQPDPPVWNGDAATRAEAPVIVVANGGSVTGQDASFVYTGSISGTAKTPEGTALINRRVILETETDDFVDNVALDAQGRFSFTGLAAGKYKLALASSLPGGPNLWYLDAPDEASATLVTLAKNGAVAGIDFTAPAESNGRVVGRVAGYTGDKPLLVAVYPAANPHPRYGPPLATAPVGADGRYAVFGLPTGNTKVMLVGEVGGYANQWYGGGMNTATVVPVVDGQTSRGIDFTAVDEAVISGTVKAPIGPGPAYIQVVNLAGQFVGDAFTEDDGSYAVHGLPAGSYKVEFSSTLRGGPVSWYGGADFDSAAVVTVSAGQTLTGIDSGVVIGEPSKPKPGAAAPQPGTPLTPVGAAQPVASVVGGELAATGASEALAPLGLAGGALGGLGLMLLLAAHPTLKYRGGRKG